MRATLLIIAGILALVVGWIYFAPGDSIPSPEELAEQALNAATSEEQEAAAVKLSQSGQAGITQLRRVYQESTVVEVRAACIKGLGVLRDYDSMAIFFDGLEDDSALIRGRAGVAMVRMLGRDYRFRANGSVADRVKSITGMQKAWEEMEPDLDRIKEEMKKKKQPSETE
ncbi:MAG: hypothetical protein OSB47_07375 [Pirellulaceae bacterium]|nr:hypothetical protein [Pirellulaceae bacterium]